MLKSAELGRVLSKQDYDAALGDLRTALLKAQAELEQASFPVIVLINGADGAGKGETLNTLSEWLDARFLHTEAIRRAVRGGARASGVLALLDVAASRRADRPISRLVVHATDPRSGDGRRQDARARAEPSRASTRSNARSPTAARCSSSFGFTSARKSRSAGSRPRRRAKSTRLLVTKSNWRHHERYDEFVTVTERVLRDTSTGQAPWTVIESADDRYRNMTAGRVVLEQIQRRLATQRESVPPQAQPEIPDPVTVLDRSRFDAEARQAKL